MRMVPPVAVLAQVASVLFETRSVFRLIPRCPARHLDGTVITSDDHMLLAIGEIGSLYDGDWRAIAITELIFP